LMHSSVASQILEYIPFGKVSEASCSLWSALLSPANQDMQWCVDCFLHHRYLPLLLGALGLPAHIESTGVIKGLYRGHPSTDINLETLSGILDQTSD